MRRVAIIFSVLAVVTSASVAVTPAASAAATCRFTPVLPKSLAVGKEFVDLTARLHVSGPSDCKHSFDVSVRLVRKTDSYSLGWGDIRPDVELVSARGLKPGVYRTTGGTCLVLDTSNRELSCSVAPAKVTIKFQARPYYTFGRRGASLTVRAIAKRYVDRAGFSPTRATVAVQRYSAGAWKTVHSAVASGSRGYFWTYTNAPHARYRLVSRETATALQGISRPTPRM